MEDVDFDTAYALLMADASAPATPSVGGSAGGAFLAPSTPPQTFAQLNGLSPLPTQTNLGSPWLHELLSTTETGVIESFLDSIQQEQQQQQQLLLQQGAKLHQVVEHQTLDPDHQGAYNQYLPQQIPEATVERVTAAEVEYQSAGATSASASASASTAASSSATPNTSSSQGKRNLNNTQRKQNHLAAERMRRQQIKEAFDRLVGVLGPALTEQQALEDDDASERPSKRRRARRGAKPAKLSKSAILTRAIDEIKSLQHILASE